MRVSLAAPAGGAPGGAVTSVFGRSGAVLANSGDYSVGQVTRGGTVGFANIYRSGHAPGWNVGEFSGMVGQSNVPE